MTNGNERFAMKTITYMLAGLLLVGCAKDEAQDRDFFTSGSREADQRAEQRIAKDEQIKGKGEGDAKLGDADANKKKTLYERLGGEKGMQAIVDDFVARAMADPRVNWNRQGVKQGGFSISRNKSVEWKPDQAAIDQLKKHIVQFLSLSTGGPSFYDGRDMKSAHAGLRITNAEFDAAVGDLKATLDKLAVATEEQKELLAIIESTRPQVVAER